METHKRTIARAACWRIVAVIMTIPFTGVSTAISIHLLLTIAHYFHERVWLRIKWGTIDSK
jgi:uncharacterized membrane protein